MPRSVNFEVLGYHDMDNVGAKQNKQGTVFNTILRGSQSFKLCSMYLFRIECFFEGDVDRIHIVYYLLMPWHLFKNCTLKQFDKFDDSFRAPG